jgi:hypothetical protein
MDGWMDGWMGRGEIGQIKKEADGARWQFFLLLLYSSFSKDGRACAAGKRRWGALVGVQYCVLVGKGALGLAQKEQRPERERETERERDIAAKASLHFIQPRFYQGAY